MSVSLNLTHHFPFPALGKKEKKKTNKQQNSGHSYIYE